MKKNQLAAHTPCPCASDQTYVKCCGPFHRAMARESAIDGSLSEPLDAPTPEVLMRARYSAYALGLIEYPLATWHPSTSPGELELSPVKWLGLEVKEHQSSGDAGVVEFVARYRVDGCAHRLHEISRFVREQGKWFYIDGQVLEPD